MLFFLKNKEKNKGEPFDCGKLKILIMLLHYDKPILTVNDFIRDNNINKYHFFRYKNWLIKEKVINPIGKIEAVRNTGFGKAIRKVEGYEIDKDRIDQIIFDKWETRILFDRADEYVGRPKYKD